MTTMMRDFQGKISIIMPAYNEGPHIRQSIEETVRLFEQLGCAYELIVVDDGSDDATYEEAMREASGKWRVRPVRLAENSGKGFALRYGFLFASGELVGFLDADLDLHPRGILRLYEVMQQSGADVVIGSKRHRGSRVNYPWQRKLYSAVYYLLIRLLFRLPVKDTQTGLKLFKQEVLEQVFPRVLLKRYALDLELLANAHRLGYKVIEAPVTINFQRGWGRIGWRDIRNIWLDTMAVFYRMYILKYYDR